MSAYWKDLKLMLEGDGQKKSIEIWKGACYEI